MGLMRSRQDGKPCRVDGHGSRCEVSEERRLIERAQEKREWRREVMREIFVEEDGGDWTVSDENDEFLALFASKEDAEQFAEWKRLEA